MISTRSSSKKDLYTHGLSMAKIWARSETLAGIVVGQVRLFQTSSLNWIYSQNPIVIDKKKVFSNNKFCFIGQLFAS